MSQYGFPTEWCKSNKFSGSQAYWFITNFEKYGLTKELFEKKFKKKFEKQFKRKCPYPSIEKAMVPYRRHKNIENFLEHKKKCLCNMDKEFKILGAYLLKNTRI